VLAKREHWANLQPLVARQNRVWYTRLHDHHIQTYGSTGSLARSSGGGRPSPYLLIYDFVAADDTATLLRVLHGKRNITEHLIKRSIRR
jgi:hypothetical protein